jgi:hypothetical protein
MEGGVGWEYAVISSISEQMTGYVARMEGMINTYIFIFRKP